MNPRIQLLSELVRDGHYVIDPRAVAEAIVLRSMTRLVVPDATFRNDAEPPRVRSFRPDRGARSFRLCQHRPSRALRFTRESDLARAS